MPNGGVHIINVCGELVCLGPLSREFIPNFQRWNNELSTSETLGLAWPSTLESETNIYEQRINNLSGAYFTVFERASGQPIGIANLYEISDRHARASFGIIIGDPASRGKGYGTEATKLVLDYAFNARGLENVMLTVLSFNHAGIRAYEKAGFKTFGTRSRCSRIGGQLHDLIYMQCLASEFERVAIYPRPE